MKRKLGKTEEAAAFLNVSPQRANEMHREGLFDEGVVVLLGRLKRWDLDRLEEWATQGGQALQGGWRHESDEAAA